jgi:tRNA(fMet)-specific endonuclease VapC
MAWRAGLTDALLATHATENIVLSAVTAAELVHGVERLSGVSRVRAEAFVDSVVALLPTIAFDLDIARTHAVLAADLRSRGVAVGAHDLIIAATAVSLDYGVATRDLRSYPEDYRCADRPVVTPPRAKAPPPQQQERSPASHQNGARVQHGETPPLDVRLRRRPWLCRNDRKRAPALTRLQQPMTQ